MKSIHFVVVASIALAGISAKIWAFEPDGNMPRSAVPEQYKWKLTPLFADDAAFTAALAGAPATMKRLTSCKGTLKNPKHLRTCLALYFDFRQALNKMTLYSSMRFDSDTSSDSLQAMSDHALKAFNDMMTDTTFFREEILALNDGTLAAAYRAEPGLKTYKPYIDEFRRRRAHVLPAQGEKVLALAGDNLWAEIDLNELPSDHEKTFNALSSDMPLPSIKDAEGKKVQLTLSNYGQLRSSKDRRVREEAVEGLFGTLRQYQHVYAGTFAGQLNLNVFLARARGYKTALDAYLDKDEIDPAVYRNLIRTIHANLQPLHDYIQLRKRAMGLKELHIYDLYPPMVKGASTVYPYETALKILPEALAPLGKEYVGMLSRGWTPRKAGSTFTRTRTKRAGPSHRASSVSILS